MPQAREIRSKIGSVQNTRKITRAMEMVAASKMRKAQERMQAARPYAEKIRAVIGHLAKSHPEYHHIYLAQRPLKRVGYIIVSTDRGLCGSLNTNLFKLALKSILEQEKQGIEVELCLLGQKAESFFKRVGGKITATATQLGDKPAAKDLIGIVKVMFDAYAAQKIDALYMVSTEFINTMRQKPILREVLPIQPSADTSRVDYYWDYIYEPDAQTVLTLLLNRYVEALVYQAVVENIASEQSARMVAMKNASDNAGSLINDLKLAYNKARQSAITRELADIIGGAEAIEKA
jgi:F-type H+-transporting ATPase subunit gamma